MTAPATFDVTITVNDVDVTAFVPLESMAFTDNARQVSTFDFTISNPTGVTPARGHEVIVTANSLAGTPVIFIGYIMELASKKRDNGITKEYEVRCADRKILLQKSVIGDNIFTGSDFDILADLLANTYPDLSSYFDFGTDITSFADGLEFPTPDGMNLLDALNDLADLTGADWRVETVTGDSASITFDDGTYTDYVLQTGTGMSSGGETASGNPGDAFQGTSGAAAADQFIQIKITLSAAIDVYDISFDGYMDAPGGAATARPRIILYLAGGQVFNSANVTGILPNDGSWYTVTASIDFTANPGDDWTAAPYNCDEIWILNSVSGAYSSSDMRLDNIIINPPAATGDPTAALYKVTTLTGSSSWSDVSPDTDVAPIAPHDLAIDLIDPDIVHTVGNDEIWYSSDDAAATWSTEEAATDKRVPLSLSPAVAFGGVSEVTVSLDGVTHDTKTGNLATLFTIGTVKRVLAL
jgi:hypothetical protein